MQALIASVTMCVICFIISYMTSDAINLGEPAIDQLWNLFFIVKDSLIFYLCLRLYLDCPFSKWRKKISYTILVGFWAGIFIHNRLIQFDVLSDHISIAYSMSLVLILTIASFSVYSTKWDNLPNDTIEPGYIYEIIGKPRGDWQVLLYIVLQGLGGSFAVTDGKTYIYMSKTRKRSVKEPLQQHRLTGKKCIKLCEATGENIHTYESKVNIVFKFWRNCYSLTKGFKNV